MTVSKWERGTADPSPYNVQQLRLMAEGAEGMNDAELQQMLTILAMGLAVAALAFIVARALGNRGRP